MFCCVARREAAFFVARAMDAVSPPGEDGFEGMVFQRVYQDEWIKWADSAYVLGPQENALGERKVDRLAAAVLLSAGISVTRVRGSNPMLPGGDSDFGDFHHFISWLTDEVEVKEFQESISNVDNDPTLPATADIEGLTVILKGGQTLWTAVIEQGFDHSVGRRRGKKRDASSMNTGPATNLRNNDSVEAFLRDTQHDEAVATRMVITDIYIHLMFNTDKDWDKGPIITEKRVDVLLSNTTTTRVQVLSCCVVVVFVTAHLQVLGDNA